MSAHRPEKTRQPAFEPGNWSGEVPQEHGQFEYNGKVYFKNDYADSRDSHDSYVNRSRDGILGHRRCEKTVDCGNGVSAASLNNGIFYFLTESSEFLCRSSHREWMCTVLRVILHLKDGEARSE